MFGKGKKWATECVTAQREELSCEKWRRRKDKESIQLQQQKRQKQIFNSFENILFPLGNLTVLSLSFSCTNTYNIRQAPSSDKLVSGSDRMQTAKEKKLK